MEAEGREKEPICPIRGRITGKGSVGEGWKETWRTGVVFIIVWIVVKEYTAWCLYLLTVLCTSLGYSRLCRTIVRLRSLACDNEGIDYSAKTDNFF